MCVRGQSSRMPHEVLTFNASSNAHTGCVRLGSVNKHSLYCHHYMYQKLSFSDVPIQIFEHLKMSHTETAIRYDVSFAVQYTFRRVFSCGFGYLYI